MSSPGFVNLLTLLGVPQAAIYEQFWQFAADLRCSIPCIVTDISKVASNQTVTVQVAIMENPMLKGVPTPTAIKPLGDVPIAVYRGGGFSITLPIAVGDECLVVFSDYCIDGWWSAGGTSNTQGIQRRHSLSDGIAIFGLCSQASRIIPNYSPSTLQIRTDDGTSVVELDANGTVRIIASTIIDLNGPVSINGTLTVSGATTLGGKVFSTHEHNGITVGTGISGPPV
jgi:hypothetical protein